MGKGQRAHHPHSSSLPLPPHADHHGMKSDAPSLVSSSHPHHHLHHLNGSSRTSTSSLTDAGKLHVNTNSGSLGASSSSATSASSAATDSTLLSGGDEQHHLHTNSTKEHQFLSASATDCSCSSAAHATTTSTAGKELNASLAVSSSNSPHLEQQFLMYKKGEETSRQTQERSEEVLLEKAPIFTLLTTYLSYFILILFGHVRDFFGGIMRPGSYRHLKSHKGLAPINSGFDTFYHRRLYVRIRDCFNRPITNVPGRTVDLLERESHDYNKTFSMKGTIKNALNLSSYNYLGFAQAEGTCADAVEAMTRRYGISSCSSRFEAGTSDLLQETEALVARFVGQEACMVVSMGFATNSTTLPALVGKGCLVISDELNHSSLVFGARLSGAQIKVFHHNDAAHLESVLSESISQGQPRTHRPWKKILVVVEGLYSMEGNLCNLPAIMALKEKYKFYVYLDEAHSVGAMGPNGRGICDYYGIDPKRIDVCMGTFTKSFGAAGGYICGSKALVDHLRLACHSAVYAESMSAPVATQIQASMKIIMGELDPGEGRRRLSLLARNAKFFAESLRSMGFIVYGSDSPVIPLLLFHPAKIPAFSRELLARGVAVVVVGYPATPIITSRVRFCISAAHTMEDLEYALKQISEVGDLLMLKVSKAQKRKSVLNSPSLVAASA